MHQSGLLIAGRYRLTATLLPDAEGVGVIADDEHSELGEVLVRHVLLPEVLSPGEPGGPHQAAALAADAATIADAVRVVAQLPDHRGLGVLRDVVADGDRVWLVQERIDPGEPLSRTLARGTLDPYRAAEIAYDVLRALRHLHRLGWHHGNLTPQTIWLDDHGSAILTGLDQAVIDDLVCEIPRSMPPPAPTPASGGPGSHTPPRPATPASPPPLRFTAAGGIAGGVRADAYRTPLAGPRPAPSRPGPQRHEDASPAARAAHPVRPPATRLEAERAQDLRMITVGNVVERWAPEQAVLPAQAPPFLTPVGPPADLWALGVLLFRAVTGRPPYPEPEDTAQLLDMVRSEPPAYAKDTGALRPLIEQLLSRDPLERPRAGELLRWLTSIHRDAPEPATTDQGPDPTPFTPHPGTGLVLRFRGPLVRRRRPAPAAPVAVAPGRHRAARRAPRRRTPSTRTLTLSAAAAVAAAVAVLTYTARTGTGPDHAASTGGPPATPPASSAGDPQPVPRPLVHDPAGFSIAPFPGSTRHTTDRTVEFRRDGITLTLVPGHDTLRPGETMLDYQAREPELATVRADPGSSASGLRLITVGDFPATAEGTYRFTLGGQPTYLRNRVTTLDGALHVLLAFGPESRREQIDTLYLRAATSYQLSPTQRRPDSHSPAGMTPPARREGRRTPRRRAKSGEDVPQPPDYTRVGPGHPPMAFRNRLAPACTVRSPQHAEERPPGRRPAGSAASPAPGTEGRLRLPRTPNQTPPHTLCPNF